MAASLVRRLFSVVVVWGLVAPAYAAEPVGGSWRDDVRALLRETAQQQGLPREAVLHRAQDLLQQFDSLPAPRRAELQPLRMALRNRLANWKQAQAQGLPADKKPDAPPPAPGLQAIAQTAPAVVLPEVVLPEVVLPEVVLPEVALQPVVPPQPAVLPKPAEMQKPVPLAAAPVPPVPAPQILGQFQPPQGGAVPLPAQAMQPLDFGPDLVDVVQDTIAPDMWDTRGGLGVIRYWAPGHALIVRQTEEVHEQIRELLNAMR